MRAASGAPGGLSPAGRWFVRGDIDGFFGLALDNLIQVLVILALVEHVLGFAPALIYGKLLPGVGVSLIVGNLFYAWQARRLALKTGRADVCALPYGINTVSLFAFVFLVMLPVKVAAEAQGASREAASDLAYRAGVIAAVGSGLIEAGGSWAVAWLRRTAPRAALLATLAGIAVTFIAIDFLFRTFASPLVAFLPLGIVLLTYFGRVRFPWGLPGGLVAVTVGTLLAWLTPLRDWDAATWATATAQLRLWVPELQAGALWHGFSEGHFTQYFVVILPMGLFNLIGSVQNLDSAGAAGDDYPTVPSLLANGAGTLLGAAFGSPFPTTIYIGHPGWKALGARIGYSALNAVFFSVLCASGAAALVGYLVPVEAGMAIVLWIGIVMVAQAFQASPREHAPAVAVGLLPGIAAWGAFMLKRGLVAGGVENFGPELLERLTRTGVLAHGAFALEQGFLITSMIWAAITAELIDKRWTRAALWALSGAVLSALGFIHTYTWGYADTVQDLAFTRGTAGLWAGATWSIGYLGLAVALLLGRWLPTHAAGHD
jgi:AGZA family xanthine/uracil permease-like MFS transporter